MIKKNRIYLPVVSAASPRRILFGVRAFLRANARKNARTPKIIYQDSYLLNRYQKIRNEKRSLPAAGIQAAVIRSLPV
jgi:hypothetical protein